MDFAVKKWLPCLNDYLSQLPSFDSLGTYYKMPISGVYALGSISLLKYLAFTKEKRTGDFSILRTVIICFEYFLLQIRYYFNLGHNTITACQSADFFALYFGNHRVRVCSVSMQQDIIVDLSLPEPEFNSNSFLVCGSGFSKWAPTMSIIDKYGRIIREQRFTGIAINRLKAKKISSRETDFIYEYIKVQKVAEKSIPLTVYISNIQDKIIECKDLLLEIGDPSLSSCGLISLLNSLDLVRLNLFKSGLSVLQTCPSHRDLNRGNVLFIPEINDLRVIDWEFFSEAVVNYDVFVFVSNVRHNQDFEKSFNYFKFWAKSQKKFQLSPHARHLFLLEELRFLLDNLSLRKEKRVADFQIIKNTINLLCS